MSWPQHAELWRAALGAAVLLAVWFLPGLGAVRLLAPRTGRLAALAVAPAASTGLLYGGGELLAVAGLPVDARLPALLCLVGAVVLVQRRGTWKERSPRALRALAGAWALGLGVWCLGVRHLLAVPPHDDGYNHGYFVARIARFATLEPAQVLAHDVLVQGNVVQYYPLGLHQQAALLVRSLDLDVAAAWTLTSLGLVVVLLPLGMLVLGHRLLPDRPGFPAACAVLSAVVPGVAVSTAWWGGFALAAGIALVPGTLVCVLAAVESRRPGQLALSALALAGVAGAHTSEWTFLGVLVGVTGVLSAGSVPELLRRAGATAVAFAGSLVVLGPVLGQLQDAAAERAAPVTDGLPLGRAVLEVVVQHSFVPPATPSAVVVAGWVGLVLAARTGGMRAWLVCWLAVAALYVWLTAYPSELVDALTSSWYSDRFRLGYLLAFLSLPLLALVVSARPRGPLRPAPALLAVAVVATSVVGGVRATRQSYADFSLVGADERAAFAFLAAHVRPGERVLDQHQDGGPWMYSLAGVPPVVALKEFGFDTPQWHDAVQAARHAHRAGSDASEDALLDRLGVRYAYLGPAVFPTDEADLDREALLRSPGWRVALRTGRSVVLERVAG